ncbi:nucleoside recognition domain-containing protein [Cellulosilyticum lentocellum]|uniref:Nucleoside recognition domain protein n=1 Tax=Cellulosilyticum lentocellum (strain ATCC 49066 / DSM 5427 / NCIMB 11756 / RHM5) TaxID=642492 RepID=F2JHN5_CELLD|nr:nucleoside recognition domain-containing protein [Cellulosilyticum lentocellum]ADZ85377.1 nucleoside recognition domain protein [Cellulosilyticum lentocellum DSM 5427]
MLNYIWSFMIIFAVLISGFTGGMKAITNSALLASGEAVTICIETLGIVAMWMGIMRIAEKSGLIDSLARKMSPILNFLFPSVPKNHPARKYIATNLIANFLGLGWAATPPGLKAMIELQKLNKEEGQATHAMCMFLIINISSIQLIPISMISYRTAYGSHNPTEILVPCIIATAVSTLVAIIFGKLMYKKED